MLSRRALLGAALAAPATAFKGTPIRLGGPVFLKSDDPEELAREHRRLGYSAAYCPKATAGDKERVRAIEAAYAKHNVVIAEVGAWVNMLDPDPEKRRKNLAYVVERCYLADAVAARCCVDIVGSYNASRWYGPHPKNRTQECFDATVENCRHVIDTVKPRRTKFSVEMQSGTLLEGPDTYLKLIKAVDRRQFGVHLDVANSIVSTDLYYNNAARIRECFQKLGRWILSCHAKDVEWTASYSVSFKEVGPGKGGLDYGAYLTELAKLPQDAPLMLEHLATAAEYEEAKQHILKVGAGLGLRFA